MGTIPNHRRADPLAGAHHTARAFRLLLEDQLEAQKTKLGEFGGLPQTVNDDHAPADFSALGSPAGIAVL